jgi:segregation and condensation protein B
MKIVTTPMCEEIVRLAGISDYAVNKFPTENDGDFAILLSESKVEMDSLAIKVNTSQQIFESIVEVSKIAGNRLGDEEIMAFFEDYELCKKYLNSSFERDVNVKVYSEFLKDIVSDVGFSIVSDDFDYVIYPDYLKDKVSETDNLVVIPSHNDISKNPFKKAELRYSILENLI